MISTTSSLKWVNELQHEILSQLIFSFTLGITLCTITQILKVRTRAMLVYYIDFDVILWIILKKVSHLMPLA